MTNESRGGTLQDLGWDERWQQVWERESRDGCVPARVITRYRTRWVVAPGDLDATGDADGKAAVGDWVAIHRSAPDGPVRIVAALPRRTALVRKAAGQAVRPQVLAANAEIAVVLASLAEPLNQRRIARYTALVYDSGATPLIVLTKADLITEREIAVACVHAEAAAPAVEVVPLSAADGLGVDALEARLAPGLTAVLLGPSGAGKSTLANRLVGADRLRTGAVRRDGRGRHTTTHRELVRTSTGALLIDTPGLRELGLWDADDGVAMAFGDITQLAATCRFRDCAHDSEPECAVRRAAEIGALDPARLDAWRTLRRELAWLDRKTDERAAARDKASTRALHRAMRGYHRK